MPFEVPPHFLRNAPNVLALGPPADIGLSLLDYLRRRVGLDSLAEVDLLDFGCGTRFADTLMKHDVALRSYTGIDVHADMVAFLAANATDPRMRFHRLDAHNPYYNPTGRPLREMAELPVDGRAFDVICLFSVITHQLPEDAQEIFRLLRRHARPTARLFFSVFIDDEDGRPYYEYEPDQPTACSVYASATLAQVLAASGWREVSRAPASDEDLPIMDSLVCEPV
jgi:SAM-dependent methyltransferase